MRKVQKAPMAVNSRGVASEVCTLALVAAAVWLRD